MKSKHELKVGNKLDVRDTEHIWCIATIEQIIRKKFKTPLVYVHYEGWSRVYDEYLSFDSPRLAPLGFFTERKDIPRYSRIPYRNHMFARVIGGGPGGLSDEEPDAAGDGLPEISPENANNEEAVDVAEVPEVMPLENPEVDDQQEVALTG